MPVSSAAWHATQPTALIAVHSYTPVYLGKARPWQMGIVFGEDRRMAALLIDGLKADPALTVGINEPYSPADQVNYTVEHHAGGRGLCRGDDRNSPRRDCRRRRRAALGGPVGRYSRGAARLCANRAKPSV